MQSSGSKCTNCDLTSKFGDRTPPHRINIVDGGCQISKDEATSVESPQLKVKFKRSKNGFCGVQLSEGILGEQIKVTGTF